MVTWKGERLQFYLRVSLLCLALNDARCGWLLSIADAAGLQSDDYDASGDDSLSEHIPLTGLSPLLHTYLLSWWRGTVVECRSLTGELSLSCARPAADG